MKTRRGKESRRPFYIALALIALAGTAAIVYVATRPSAGVATVDPALAPGEAEGYLLGDPNAPVQILEFADFQCPACERFATITEPDIRSRIVEQGLASFRFYDFPLPQHRNALNASLAAACANDQGKFWEYHDRLFRGQPDWSNERNPKGLYAGYARELGLDVARWEQCYDDRTHVPTIMANKAEGERRQISQTPTFVIGNRVVPGAISYDQFRALVDTALAQARTAAPADGTARDTSAAPAGATR